MAGFTANVNFTGIPNFGIVDIDANQVAQCLQQYLTRGSQLTGVSVEDIDRSVHTMPANLRESTLVDLINSGMKLFDAIVWLSAGRPTSHSLRVDPSKSKDTCPTMHEIAKCVFYCYFFLLTQARYPVKGANEEKPNVPNFLRVVMGMTEDQSYYVNKICSFNPQTFNPSWVKYVNFQNLGQEALSRFGLGVAGYRMFGPFKLYRPRDDLSPELRNAYEFARTVAAAPPTWDVHPLTRDPRVLNSRGNLNKNLNNLILECFTQEQIAEMVNAKVIYKTPVREPAYMNYRTWNANDDISGTTQIFRIY